MTSTIIPTIAAIATGHEKAGVGIIRISGSDAERILCELTSRPKGLRDRHVYYGRAHNDKNEVLDEVLYFFMKGPRSFTGEDIAEVHGHGGQVNLGRLLRAVFALGAEPAAPGEFTRRALENGRIDLVQAEALPNIVAARSGAALRAAQMQLAGTLGASVESLATRCNRLLAIFEKHLDFPEDDVFFEVLENGELDRLAEDVRSLEETFGVGNAITNGITVALCGPTNAGKSSLFNMLCGRERAIVSETPGTTRDFLEEELVWDGVPVRLVDTAGYRDADSDVEFKGIALGRERAESCDIEIHVTEWEPSMSQDVGEGRIVNVVSKSDLSKGSAVNGLSVSTVSDSGAKELKAAVLARVGAVEAVSSSVIITTERQRRHLSIAGDALEHGVKLQKENSPIELIASQISDAGEELALVTGSDSRSSMLDELFAQFCIGK